MLAEIPKHAKNVELGVYVVMPNHVHGILILNGNSEACAVNTGGDKGVEAGDKACLHQGLRQASMPCHYARPKMSDTIRWGEVNLTKTPYYRITIKRA